MNIVIDARWIFLEISGVGSYTVELIRNLAALDQENQYTLLFNDPAVEARTVLDTDIAGRDNFTTRLLDYGVFSLKNQVSLRGFLRSAKADVFHSANYMIPLPAFPRHRLSDTACVVNVHDVIPLVFPRHAPRSRKARVFPIYKRIMVEVGARSDIIITASSSARDDIIKHMRIRPEHTSKIRLIPDGVSAIFKPATSLKPMHLHGDPRTILYVGRSDPYKNIVGLVEAFARLQAGVPFPVTLKVVGPSDPRYPEGRMKAEELGVADSVQWTGYLDDINNLVSAYQNADVLVHPSRYEGFGLQIIEAMACGLPVVCSNASSIPEVAGDAALMVDPDDTEGFTANMKAVLTDGNLAEALRSKGLQRAEKFKWEHTARETLLVYEQAAQLS